MRQPTGAENRPRISARQLGCLRSLTHTVGSLGSLVRSMAFGGAQARATDLWPGGVRARCRNVLLTVLPLVLVGLGVSLALGHAGVAQERAPVHAVVDLGHQFTFYADGRFHRQYLPDQPVAMSWGALFHYDFANANLLILLGCDPHLRYVPEDIHTISAFLDEGGGVVLLGSTADEPQNALAREFGCAFGPPAQKPLRAASAPVAGEIAGGGDILNLQDTNQWRVLMVDAQGKPMLARRTMGKGTLLVGARGLAGQNPDASDNINAAWWQPLLADVASGKRVDPAQPFRSRGWGELEHSESLGPITLRYSSYLKPYAKSMADIHARCRPVIERRMGVPLAEGMASEIVLLATGGGGFSSGRTLGLAVFWGGFPDREDSMIEFITHESVHSWVLPFAEVWNEPIATYVGNLVMIDMGHEAEARRRIRDTIARASRLDPTMTLYDLEGKGRAGARSLGRGEANDIHWGKTFWVFEQLRQDNPDVIARYFQAKRRLAGPDQLKQYDVHATVGVLSVALERDLFPWFNAHGIEADPGKSSIAPVAEAPALRPRGHVFFQADFEGTDALHGWAGSGKLECGLQRSHVPAARLHPPGGVWLRPRLAVPGRDRG